MSLQYRWASNYPNGFTATYAYDSMGRPLSVMDNAQNVNSPGIAWASNAIYNSAGQLASLDRAGPATIPDYRVNYYAIQPFTQTWTYNQLNQLTEIDGTAANCSCGLGFRSHWNRQYAGEIRLSGWPQ